MENKKRRGLSKSFESRIRASLSEIEFVGRPHDQILNFLKVCCLCRRGICTLECSSRIYLENSSILNKKEFAKVQSSQHQSITISNQWRSSSVGDDSLLGGFCCACCECNGCKRKFDAVMASEAATEITFSTLRETPEPMGFEDNREFSFQNVSEEFENPGGADEYPTTGNYDHQDYHSHCLNVDEANYLVKTTGRLAGEKMFSRRIQIEVSKNHFISASMPAVEAVTAMGHLVSNANQENHTIKAAWPNLQHDRMQMFFPRGQYHSVLMFLDVYDTAGEKRCLGICNCRVPKGNLG